MTVIEFISLQPWMQERVIREIANELHRQSRKWSADILSKIKGERLMNREFTVYKSGDYWIADGMINGQRRKKHCKIRKDADTFARLKNLEIEKHGATATLDDSTRVDAMQAHKALEGTGVSILEAAEWYKRHMSQAAKSVTVKELTAQCELYTQEQVGKGEKSLEHLQAIRKVGRALTNALGESLTCDLTRPVIVKWLDTLTHLSDTSKDFYRRYAMVIFAYGVARGYSEVNPAHGITKVARKKDIAILTPDQAKKLLEVCDPRMTMYYAIGMFAGLRPASELLRLRWDEVFLSLNGGADYLEVENIKTARHNNSARTRYVDIQPNLRKWIDSVMPHGVSEHPAPGNWRDFAYGSRGKNRKEHQFESDRQLAGIEWAADIMRHSFASYHPAKFETAAKLALEMGHTSEKLIFDTYRKRVTKADAERFWSIVPD